MLRASYGIYYGRQNMLSQVGSITDNGVQQQTASPARQLSVAPLRRGPAADLAQHRAGRAVAAAIRSRASAACACSARTTLTRASTRRTSQFEQEIANDLSLYFDFTHSKGVHLTRFLNLNRSWRLCPNLGDVFVTSAVGKSLYRRLYGRHEEAVQQALSVRVELRACERQG